MYKCEVCGYNTDIACNFERHEKSASHLRKMHQKKLSSNENLLKCICGKTYKHRSSLNYHKKKFKCFDTISNNNRSTIVSNSNNCHATSFEQASKLLNAFGETGSLNKNDAKIVLNFNNVNINTTSNTTNIKKMNLVNQANYLYPNAPNLKKIDDYRYLDSDNYEDFVEELIYHHRMNMLDKYFGEYIIKYYKKKDISEQSLHNTDIPRLNFIIKSAIDNNSTWHTDGKGIETLKTIIKPMLEYAVENLMKYIKEKNKKCIKYRTESKKYLDMSEKISYAGHIERQITKRIIEKSILRFIAPHFKLNRLMEEEDEDSNSIDCKVDKIKKINEQIENLQEYEIDELLKHLKSNF